MDDKNLPLLDQLIEASMKQLVREARESGDAPGAPPRRNGTPRTPENENTAVSAIPDTSVRQPNTGAQTQKISFEHTLK
ncbi:MAG: hypothetical protein ACR2RB_07025, partial [Gammaproteobacteria bacterium]